MRNDFCVFILTHGRPNNVRTFDTLNRYGYTGALYFLVDNEDSSLEEYRNNFGADKVLVFNKPWEKNEFDVMDNFGKRKCIVYARNACFEIAKELVYKYFIELDDDYYYFGIRTTEGACKIKNLDEVFELLVDYLEHSPVHTVAFSQGGDHIGGYDDTVLCKRKAMNSFVCSTDKPFKFIGNINEDVNTYVHEGSLGKIFLTVMNLQLDQCDTQTNEGGMTETYIDGGTYIKSFYSVICNPSSVRVESVGLHNKRLHHHVLWENAVPKIINPKYRKGA